MGTRLVAVALAALVVAGCGHSTAGGSRPVLSRSEFVAQASQVCRDATTRAERVAGLARLRPPAAANDLYNHWLAAEREALAAEQELEHPTEELKGDPSIPLTIAEGKITGYVRRLVMHACEED